ncbi:WxcM-like domain-containing protein [Thiohalocapsa marina]|uniref:WxcM-like domain-containing protein n=2 Tax=Thiohalocapsa marina TaxID=424902 RepID=A0A5M8FGI3_9GAMM|nr:WxcM-like domain-containing protein [Thiohalocapsa marina]
MPEDATFILSLRTDEKKSRYLSTTAPDLDAQRSWLQRYATATDQAYFIIEHQGNLTFIEGGNHIPFDIQRVYYLYDVPGGAERGGHAHKALQQLIIAMSGSFDIVLDDGKDKVRYHLNRSYSGLYVCPMMLRELDNFSSGSVCMVLASNRYDEDDYYRDYAEFMRARWGGA